ncbi:hypothetical protein BUALT_Bualt09G0140000 [Buddleja alternifolia]|uniref:SWIM-type domain-containing protein n=1 Tax=Buddleja alternifolia TaxID=168488 RepID=A0AAV6XAI7_9LAMI|nr:hypothetical protein BUALT_Bualt09G0140000 [Buddleja alternifolia]
MAQSRAAVLGKGKVSEEENSEVDAMAQSRAAEKSKSKMAEQNIPFTVDEEDSRSEFDDSSDEDYLEFDDSEDDEEGYKELVEEGNYDGFEELEEEPNVGTSGGTSGAAAAGNTSGAAAVGGTSDEEDIEGEFSDSPNFILDDIEGSSDDDIFLGKNPTKAELLKKLRKFISYDLGEKNEFFRLDGSDDEIGERSGRRHQFFREEEWNMKGKSLVVGMKFEKFRMYKEALRDYCTFDNKLAKSSYIAKRLEKMIRNNPHVSNDQLRNAINRKCEVEVSSAKVSRAKRATIDKIVGLDSKQYALLWDYCETVRARNPGSLILLRRKEDVEPPTFDKMYMSLHAMKQGFLSGCRPIIGLDGCFMKTLFGGQLLVAVGRDGNDNMVPIAIAVDIGGMESASKWTFIFDRQKGLIEALSELATYAEHIFCLRHRIEPADPKIDENVKTTAEWLREVPFQHWCRAYFKTSCKSDILNRLMSRIQMKKEGMLKYAGVVCPNIFKKINKQSKVARNCTTRFCGGMEFEVDHLLDKHVVDLDRKTCTCGMYRLNGYLCCHVYAAIANKRNDMEDCVDVCYKKKTYLQVYEYMIHVVPSQRDYIKTNYPPLRAPAIKRKRGRPKKPRMRVRGEGLNNTRKGLTHTCKNCLEMDHNKGSCTNPTYPNSKLYRGPVADQVLEAPQQTENAATQQTDGFDVPQPRQTSQSAPIGTDGTWASGSNQ